MIRELKNLANVPKSKLMKCESGFFSLFSAKQNILYIYKVQQREMDLSEP